MTVKLGPTFTCFNDALETLVDLVHASQERYDDLRLVHGILLMQEGEPYSHAWIECITEGRPFVITILMADGVPTHFIASRGEYYRDMQVQSTTKYTVEEAIFWNELTDHYGPWMERYQELCREVLAGEANP